MKIQYRERFRSSLRLLSAVLLVTILALFFAPNAFACHKGKPHGRNAPPCDDGRDPFPTIPAFAEAYFDDVSFQVVSAPGLEFERSANADYDSGDYIADPLDLDLVMIDTRSFNKRVLKGKRNGDLCHAMNSGMRENGPLESTPDKFSYGWTDDCRDGQCAVEISLRFSGQDVIDLSGGRSDQIDIVMYATISDTISDDPFLVVRNLPIDVMEAEYNKLGTSRPLVQCQLLPSGNGPGRFHSIPITP